ncbi:PREDICTED: neuronal acetylcholine receptor subunit alpha-10-like [Papilio polytes]|uniref:neuronal acetylcholine receptor subunit alpha-10-like n=1 Tax=Papilio polytes TaxID=76194 RepID=UPI00067664CD|nr:PREDICTED: neuronal acetylcholine receptor subunit alpha-10-like [Papilio polytes]
MLRSVMLRRCIWMILSFYLKGTCGCDEEYKLIRHLMQKYDASVRPVENSSQPLLVTFGVSLHHIIDVEEKDQLLTTNCWITQIWTDYHLRWNTSDFDGISVIRIPYERVWRPDIILYNNADPNYKSAVINTNVIVKHTGEVTWLSHGIYVSVCDINVEQFPFDIQLCTMKWASWTYDGFQLDLIKQFDEGDTTNYQTNGEFDLVSFEAIRHDQYYSCCVEPYPDITYVIKLRRRPMFYVFNLILPCLLINGIALLVFYVPSESGEKVTLGISALLSMTVFLMTIRDTLPPTEKTPLISLYYGVSTCLVSFSASLSVVTLNISYRGVRGQPVPAALRELVLQRLARLLFINFDTDTKGDSPPAVACVQVNPRTGSRLKSEAHCERCETCHACHGCHGCHGCDGSPAPPGSASPRFPRPNINHLSRTGPVVNSPSSPPLGVEMCGGAAGGAGACARCVCCCTLRDAAARHEQRVAANERLERANLEWKQVAVVADRALLAVFVLVTTIATAAILLPQLQNLHVGNTPLKPPT